MQAIILNSGKGSRLKELTTSNPKCLVALDSGNTLLSRQIDRLAECGITDIIITTGYLEGKIKQYLQDKYPSMAIRFVYNEEYDTTNYIVSLDKLCSMVFPSDILLMHGDLLFSGEVLQSVMEAPKSTVVVDSLAPIPEKDFKARIGDDGLVKQIGIDVFGDGCLACQPLYKLLGTDWAAWQGAIHSFCLGGQTNVYAENALNSILGRVQLGTYDAKGLLCMEVDNQEDLARARGLLGFKV
ncbi:putative sugar nucleotidyltransferase [Sphaerochaeta pleomorpha str. Grapes]|uniref:Putative sugar nucleotidyltransferase n=1 Tax=Sphaerochaeta pleomorpha (strain ATCC BAA-1885 / DSM 22778 / Grapes) TaxID=158190 RepID=G8QVS6_SPHPG|nr:NTP transferase domain-containing protein [Sphaerochaeta pleomorpha]AEV29368.1 putative sugar nucleotidyltransferase [Sphaerochaeta pleomorpha str. Grapes]